MIRLEVAAGTGALRTVEAREGVVRLGRTPDCELPIEAVHVSALHATISAAPDGWVLRDQSTNGTRVVRDSGRIDLGERATREALLEDGVATRRGIMCSHREDAWAGLPLPHALPHSESAQDGCILLPLFPGMTAAEQELVADSLARACATAPACTAPR
jgi:hypothetical protein